MATACWAFIVAKSTPVETASLLGFCGVARLQHENSSTTYAQAAAHRLWTSWRAAEVPRNTASTQRFQGQLYRSVTVAGDKYGPIGRSGSRRARRRKPVLRTVMFARRTRFLPDEKTRRPTRLSGQYPELPTELVTATWSPNPRMPMTWQLVRLAGIEPATLSLGGRCSIH
jgi:hypothetical protein